MPRGRRGAPPGRKRSPNRSGPKAAHRRSVRRLDRAGSRLPLGLAGRHVSRGGRRNDALGQQRAPAAHRAVWPAERRQVEPLERAGAARGVDRLGVAGTTTDPVEKPMELLPLGPVLFIDTAGIDDAGALGELRVAKTRQVFDRTDLAVLVAEAAAWGDFERQMLDEFQRRRIPAIVAFNKIGPLATVPAEQADACATTARRTARSSRSSRLRRPRARASRTCGKP